LGERFNEARALTYLQHAPRMVAFFQAQTALQFVDGNQMPDMHGKSPGAATGGRSVCAAPFDGRRLGKRIEQLKPPLDVLTLWGMNIASGADMRHFYNGLRSFASFRHVCRRLLRHGFDRLVYGRGMHLVNGNALVAALAVSAIEAGVDIRVSSPALQLTRRAGVHGAHGAIAGAIVESRPGQQQEIRAARGVVLACGGFPHDVARKQALLPHAPTGEEHWSAGSRGNTGDGLRLAESVGAVVSTTLASAAAMAPVSLVPAADGGVRHFPHLLERGKPGLIAVTRVGRRFTNEADPYYDFMRDLIAACPKGDVVEAWLVVDHRFIRRYGLGAVKPMPMRLSGFIRSGYLKCAATIADLARDCGIDAATLSQTIDTYNHQAKVGKDVAFGKGETPYNRMQGDAGHGLPNPCMAPLEKGPFYAVRVVPGSLGTFAGVRTSLVGQVLDGGGAVIDGLYACGNDMSSMMEGFYPSGGITLGPAMTFGYLLAHHAAGVATGEMNHVNSDGADLANVSTHVDSRVASRVD
jgi:succinate dehydrogenase/fumarate reductase flavoprotein subunit